MSFLCHLKKWWSDSRKTVFDESLTPEHPFCILVSKLCKIIFLQYLLLFTSYKAR